MKTSRPSSWQATQTNEGQLMKPSMNYHRRAGNVLQAICAASILGGSTSAQVSQAPAMTTGTAAAAPISVMRESFGTHFS
ncbi:MAG TPA: hypothetical protein PKE00_15005, partial [Planctomycetota bacterium]|nr:hypothetical protein [Planctomycetota bacterium]